MSNKTKYIAAFLAASAAFFVGVKNDEGFTSKPV
ncbi:lysozyme, partial [Acinetobacter baumannii]|nr:lysozyme [Acinetobacter baumannii]MDA3522931.1 lysozyme [Acinetobacter baumannii]